MSHRVLAAPEGDPARADPAAFRHVRDVTLSARSSFLSAMRFLPRIQRNAMFAIYAFCREVDDIADGDDPIADKVRALEEWKAEIDRLYAGKPLRETARALAGPVAAFGLDRDDFIAIIDGMEMDVREEMRAPDSDRLELYCRRVAGAVGLLSIRVFGATGEAAREFAIALGNALQLTNILRDLEEDAAMERLYLPRELLLRHGIKTTDPAEVLAHPHLSHVCRDVAVLAQHKFDEAEKILLKCPGRALRPAVVMMVVYQRILERLLKRGWQVPGIEVGLSKPEKLWIAFRYGVL